MAQTGTRNRHEADGEGGASEYHSHGDKRRYIDQSEANGRRVGQHIASGSITQRTHQMSNHNGSSGFYEENNIPRMTQPTPLFERLVTEEVQELKAYARIIENQNRRLAELERVHGDLEARLEMESRGRVQLETTLEERERQWALKFEELQNDRDHWKEIVKVEQTKNARLIDQVVRKDQDIHRMLQRKYDNQRESPGSQHTQSIRNLRHTPNERQNANSQTQNSQDTSRVEQQFGSPHEILAASGTMEAVRMRNVKNLLLDLFGM